MVILFLAVIVVILLIVLIAFISILNGLRVAEVKIMEAASGIDVALTKRYDMLTKMLDVAKGYAKHELETLTAVINLRKGMTMAERNEANEEMTKAFDRINVVAESYPELRSSENFKQLQLAIADVEEHLQAARRAYNANVSSFNQKVVTFPTSIIANMKGITVKEFFTAEEAKREDVKMEF